MKRKKILCQEW